MELLRTYVTVTDLSSFTRAAEVLQRTQPAISLQMRRLEEIVKAKLIMCVGRELKLTEEGEFLMVYARQILCLNDEALSRVSRSDVAGRLCVGLPTDYAVAFFQSVLTQFSKEHREVNLEIYCKLSRELLDDLNKDSLDVVIAMTGEGAKKYLAREWVERPMWVSAKTGNLHKRTPVPVAAHPEGCAYRNRMVQALSSVQREWRLAYCSPGITGLQNAVLSGLGVSALTKRTYLDGMRILTEKDGFPALSDLHVGLYYKHVHQADSGLQLVNYIIARLDETGEPDFKSLQSWRPVQ
jgi:DNA-binding transcriptional LysR family regulator